MDQQRARPPLSRSISSSAAKKELEPKPEFDDLDPAVTAAILTQAAFRGYRLRMRLRRLPAREAERTIRGLQSNAHGFRRLGLFLVFCSLYLYVVFDAIDVSFQRTVVQGLRSHLAKVKYGPNADRTHEDVKSLSDVHEWMQAFYLQTYHGTQVEHPCTACAVKPPDDICDSCDFSLYDSAFANGTIDTTSSSSSAEGIDEGRQQGEYFTSGSSSSGSTSWDLSEECQACVVARLCTGPYLDNCIAHLNGTLGGDGSGNVFSSTTINASVFDDIELQPSAGVSHAKGYTSIENASQCSDYAADVGYTENLARFNVNFRVIYDGMGYVADRNRIVGGMLVTFNRRKRVPSEGCEVSLDYYDVCVADEDNTDPIVPQSPVWRLFRPNVEIFYNTNDGGFISRGGYPILIDAGGFNVGLNFGYCTLLVMEDIDLIPPEEVADVSVQLVTYNGNGKSAYGSLWVQFEFTDGGKVQSTALVDAYVLKGNIAGPDDSGPWVAGILFICIFLGMAWHDTTKWRRGRRSKVKRNCFNCNCSCSCCCGFCFHLMIAFNVLFWMVWALTSTDLHALDDSSTSDEEQQVLGSVTSEVLFLLDIALFVSVYEYVFLFTTLAALYRWIFHILSFHKRMSIVTDTLSKASTHLDHFIFVMLLVVLVFSNLTWLLVGSTAVEFSTFEEAWKSIIRVSLGESENFYPQILAAQPQFGPVVVVLYQVLAIILLLNVVIAVLLEAYRGVRGGMKGEDTIFQSLVAFLGLSWCSFQARMRWGYAYVRWRLLKRRSPLIRRPSFKIKLQGPTGVYGVDGKPVLMVRRLPKDSGLYYVGRHLSFNCPRYITVREMQALIEATPVPAVVASRLVRKIVHEWIFCSDEKLSGDSSATLSGSFSSRRRSGSAQSLPMLRRNLKVSSALR
ncbi:unnamed protein product [Ascophyllum nodosum]